MPLCLHKSEWNRLKSQADPPEKPRKEDDKYIKHLIETSQKWVRSWPHTCEGQLKQIQKRKKKDHKQEYPAGAALRQQQQHSNTRQAISKARQLIFEGSSSGKQLLSALLASKVIEEREAQIALKKEIEARELELEQDRNNDALYFCKSDQEKLKQQRKTNNILFARDNKSMYEELNAKYKKEKTEKARWEREDALLMQELLDWEKQEEEKARKYQEEQKIIYGKEQQEFREAKVKRESENDAKIEKAKKEYDRKLMKIRLTHKQIIINKGSSDAIEKSYKILEEIEKEKRKRFEEYIDKRDKQYEQEEMEKEQVEINKQNRERKAKNLLSKQYKIAMEEACRSRINRNICTCDRQCLIGKSHNERCGKHQKQQMSQYQPDPKTLDKKLQFLSPQRRLIEELRQREKVPSPWTGTSGAHVQFGELAGQVLSESKHKTMAKKVVDEYRRINRLEASTLPVKNY